MGGEEVVSLFLRLGSKKLFMEIDDKPQWEETKNGVFSARAMYKLLEVGSPSVFPSGNIWGVRVQPKLCFFAWEASWEKS